MKQTTVLLRWCVMFTFATVIQCISQRKIYTLFTKKTSWNEAKEVCHKQFGQLLKVESDRDLIEIKHLDEHEWSFAIRDDQTAGGRLWTGLHLPFSGNASMLYQDCEEKSSIAVNYEDPLGKCVNYMKYPVNAADSTLQTSECSQQGMFICERFVGDCWFEPYLDVGGKSHSGYVFPYAGTHEAHECALECRNAPHPDTSSECWAFIYLPTTKECDLYFVSTSIASADSKTVSAYYLSTSNHLQYNDSVFYVRRCFEGSLDNNVYNLGVRSSSPNSVCTTNSYTVETNVTSPVCFCSNDAHPPIPEPKSSEDKAAEYVANLTINASNTSAAQRKLISSEDNRPSAIGVGSLGVIMLSVVFGGVFLMDLNIFYAGIKQLFSSAMSMDPNLNTVNPDQEVKQAETDHDIL